MRKYARRKNGFSQVDCRTERRRTGVTIEEFEKATLEKLKLVDEVESETIDRVLEIIDEEDQNRRSELGVAYDDGSITVADRIRERVNALRGGKNEQIQKDTSRG